MKVQVQLSAGIESFFGTRDENMRLIEEGLDVRTRVTNDSIEIEGEDTNVLRAESILVDYAVLLREGFVFQNGDLNNYLRVVLSDPEVTLRSLAYSGRQRAFGKKTLAPKTHEPASLHRRNRAQRSYFRRWSRGHRKDISRCCDGGFGASEQACQPYSAYTPGG